MLAVCLCKCTSAPMHTYTCACIHMHSSTRCILCRWHSPTKPVSFSQQQIPFRNSEGFSASIEMPSVWITSIVLAGRVLVVHLIEQNKTLNWSRLCEIWLSKKVGLFVDSMYTCLVMAERCLLFIPAHFLDNSFWLLLLLYPVFSNKMCYQCFAWECLVILSWILIDCAWNSSMVMVSLLPIFFHSIRHA